MPRAARKIDHPQGTSEPSETHRREALQIKSANPLKRSLDDDSVDYSVEELLRKRTASNKSPGHEIMSTAAIDNSMEETDGKEVEESAPPTVPRVTGEYAITISEFATHHKFDTSTYKLTLFHYLDGENSQLYAEFKFDHLEGIMRLLPEDLFNAKTEPWDIYDFIAYCKIPEEDRPSPELSRWLMRWRGQDGGMRLNEHVGGEPWNAPGIFNFKFDEDVDDEIAEDGIGLRFSVVFAYDCKLFSFSGTKVRDLDASEAEASANVAKMEERWHLLDNPAWYEDRDEDPEPEIDPEPQSDSMFDLVKTPMPELRRGYQKQEWEEQSESEARFGSSSPVKRTEV